MTAERFTLDTNVLVYSVDNKAGRRHEIASELVDRAVDCDCHLTLQALSEFYSAVTRKGIVPAAEAAAQATDWLDLFPCVAASAQAARFALASASSGRAAYWDALLIGTAVEAGCAVILTEDLADGAKLGGIEIRNPFAARGLSADLRRRLGLS